jgi:Flp pilus assembly protein TadD
MIFPVRPQSSRRPALRVRSGVAALAMAAALGLGGCAQPQSATDPTITGAIANPVTPDDFQKAAAYWGQRYQANTKDRDAALNYGTAEQRLGDTATAVSVLQVASVVHPGDRDILAALGKAYAASGDLEQALATIRQAEDPDKPDWKLASAEAAILDQMGNHDDARKLYARAQALAPNEPSIASNFGMSYMLTGDLAKAETLLRQAVAMPGADSRVRQNLALVVGLEGRFDEAQKIAAAELPPDQAAANIAYLKQMLGEQDVWKKLKGGGSTG